MLVHNAIKELAVLKGIGHTEAEDLLRMEATRTPDKARIVAEIDAQRKAASDAARAHNHEMAEALGLSWEKATALTELLANRPDVLTWLSKRVHLAIAHDRPLRDDE